MKRLIVPKGRGSILVTVMWLSSIIMLLMLVVGAGAIKGLKDSGREIDNSRARYASFAGMQMALGQLRQDETWGQGPWPAVIDGTLPQNPELKYQIKVWNNLGGAVRKTNAGDTAAGVQIDVPGGVVYLECQGRDVRVPGNAMINGGMAGNAIRDKPAFNQAALGDVSLAMVNSKTDGGGTPPPPPPPRRGPPPPPPPPGKGTVASNGTMSLTSGTQIDGDIEIMTAAAVIDPVTGVPTAGAEPLTQDGSSSFTGVRTDLLAPKPLTGFVAPFPASMATTSSSTGPPPPPPPPPGAQTAPVPPVSVPPIPVPPAPPGPAPAPGPGPGPAPPPGPGPAPAPPPGPTPPAPPPPPAITVPPVPVPPVTVPVPGPNLVIPVPPVAVPPVPYPTGPGPHPPISIPPIPVPPVSYTPPGPPPPPTPKLDPGPYSDVYLSPGAKLTLKSGRYYVPGKFEVDGATLEADTSSGPVIIYVGKEFIVKNGAKINEFGQSRDIQFYMTDELEETTVDPDTGVATTEKYSTVDMKDSMGTFVLAGKKTRSSIANSTLNGAIMAATVNLNNSTIHYDATLKDAPLEGMANWSLDGLHDI